MCFHSPTSLPEHEKSFGRWISARWNEFVDDDAIDGIRPDEAKSSLVEFLGAVDDDGGLPVPDEVLATDNGIEAWHAFGNHLEEAYQIHQFAVVEWDSA